MMKLPFLHLKHDELPFLHLKHDEITIFTPKT